MLFVTSAAFNKTTGGGITFTNIFTGWSKDAIATVHNDAVPVTTEVCERYYRLSAREVRRWGPLQKLAPAGTAPAATMVGSTPPRAMAALKLAKHVIFGDGVPEVAKVSPELGRWIRDYRPEVLYTILGSNGMMSLVEQLSRRFDLPIVLHFMDDWPATLYRGGLLSFLQRRRMHRLLTRLTRRARYNLGIGDAMCAAYAKRYGVPFTPFQNTIDLTRWSSQAPKDDVAGSPVVLYVGSVLPFAQLESLIDCCHAVAALAKAGVPVRLEIYSPLHNAEQYRSRLEVASNISLRDTITDDAALFERLKSADVLLLPVNFDRHTIEYIRYSMPTKVPAYLASGVPIIVYGPRGVAQIDYAVTAGWGHVVAARGADRVKAAMRELLQDFALRRRVADRALASARAHDAAVVRPRFQALLRSAARTHSGPC